MTPEYPGIVKRVVEAAHGGHCLFVQGACGDVGPSELFVPELETYRRLGAHARSRGGRHRVPRRVARAPPAGAAGRGLGVDRVVRVRARRASRTPRSRSRRRRSPLPLRDDLGDRRVVAGGGGALRGGGVRRRATRARREGEIRELTVRTKFARMRAERGDALDGLDAYPLLVHGDPARAGRARRRSRRALLRARDGDPRRARRFATTLVSAYWNGYRNYLPTDAERRARRLRDRHLAVPPRLGRDRNRGGGTRCWRRSL